MTKPETLIFPGGRKRRRRWLSATGLLLLGLLLGVSAGLSTHSTAKPSPGPTVTQTVTGAAAPGPTITVTETDTPPPPPADTVIAKYKGHGNQVVGPFTVPDNGDYILTWSYSGNTYHDGTGIAANFSIDTSGNGYGDTANDAQASGSGSTEVTGATNASARLNVQATGDWVITIKTAE